ncbi:hypothetical protein ILYODFUR_027771 [Ilyodon furcidens]|uniref:Uncharacterized protein n=1 Tax=Ilyodon furcidens TaxID=33524 RepID=A0ABV0UYJ2_9TELE
MFFRRAWQRVGPLARWLIKPISKTTAPVRHLAFGIPGGSSNLAYVVLCGGGVTAAVVYVSITVLTIKFCSQSENLLLYKQVTPQ